MRQRVPLPLAFGGFAGLGLADGTLGTAWPHIRATFGLPLGALGVLLLLSTAVFIVTVLPIGRLVGRFGVKPVVSFGVAWMAVSMATFAISRNAALVVVACLLFGAAAAPIDAGVQVAATIVSSARTLTLLHTMYSVGTLVGPALITGILVAGAGWRVDYALLATFNVLVLAMLVLRRPRPAGDPATTEHPTDEAATGTGLTRAYLVPMALFFAYVGIEASAGQWAATFFEDGRHTGVALAGAFVTGYWGAIAVARGGASAVAGRLPAIRMLDASLLITSVAVVTLALSPLTLLDGFALALVGVGLAAIYPSLMVLTPSRAGLAATPHAVGFQIAAGGLGAAVVPAAVGGVLQFGSVQLFGPCLVALCALLVVLRLPLRD